MKIIVIKILLISISFARTGFNLQLFVKDQKKKRKMGVHYPSEIFANIPCIYN